MGSKDCYMCPYNNPFRTHYWSCCGQFNNIGLYQTQNKYIYKIQLWSFLNIIMCLHSLEPLCNSNDVTMMRQVGWRPAIPHRWLRRSAPYLLNVSSFIMARTGRMKFKSLSFASIRLDCADRDEKQGDYE